jgi:hypothetical protein
MGPSVGDQLRHRGVGASIRPAGKIAQFQWISRLCRTATRVAGSAAQQGAGDQGKRDQDRLRRQEGSGRPIERIGRQRLDGRRNQQGDERDGGQAQGRCGRPAGPR